MLERIPRPLFVLAVLAIFALGLALGTNAFVARKLSVAPERLSAARSGAPAARAATPAAGDDDAKAAGKEGEDPELAEAPAAPKERSALVRGVGYWMDPIVGRNLFDSTNELAGKKDEPTAEPNPDGVVDRKSDIAATLIATSVASEPIWSTALISTDDGVNVYRIDEALLDAIVKDIQRPTLEVPARVILLRNGSLEYLEAGEPGQRRTSSAKKSDGDEKETPKPRAAAGQHDWSGIKNVGTNKYEVPEGDVKYALDNLDKMAREARVVPNFADGKTNGFKVYAIRRNSALRNMGLMNNDVLTAVNGFDLSNQEKALEIYAKLQNEKSLTLEILRDGAPVTLEYEIR